MAFAGPRQQTDQIEMSRLEGSGTWSDEDSHRLQADGILLRDGHRPAGEVESNDGLMHSRYIT